MKLRGGMEAGAREFLRGGTTDNNANEDDMFVEGRGGKAGVNCN